MLPLFLVFLILSIFTLFLLLSSQDRSCTTTTLLKAQITTLQTALQTEREDGLDLSQQIKHKCAELVAFNSQASALRDAIQILKNDHEALKAENELLVETVAGQNAELEAKGRVIAELYKIREQETSAWQSNISGTIRAFQGRIDELNTTILKFRDSYRKLEYNHDVLNERNKALVNANKEVEGRNGELRWEKQAAEEKKEELEEKNEELEEKCEELGEMLRELMSVLGTVGESLEGDEEEEWVGVEHLVDEALAESW